MAFLGIALNSGGVECCCILVLLKQTMAFLEIAFNTGGVQCFCISLFLNIRWRSWRLRLTAVACNVFASCLKTDDGVLRDLVLMRLRRFLLLALFVQPLAAVLGNSF